MPITITKYLNGAYHVQQTLIRPRIYLDHWAVRLFSENEPLQARFTKALKNSGGTLMFSHMNLAEFSLMTDKNQAIQSEEFLDACLPNVYIADTISDLGFSFQKPLPIHADHPGKNWLIKELALQTGLNNGIPTFRTFITEVIKERNELGKEFDGIKKAVSATVKQIQTDPAKIKDAKAFKAYPGMSIQDALRAELIREPQLGNPEPFTENDSIDYIHAVPAVAVCDFVLLDGKWCTKIERAKRRLKKAGVHPKLAQCFSNKGNGVANFLTTLENI